MGKTEHTKKASMSRRCFSHHYDRPGLYLVTLNVAERMAIFGRLVAESSPQAAGTTEGARNAGTTEGARTAETAARIALSELGLYVQNGAEAYLKELYPMASIWRLCIMPDHIHMIIRVSAQLPPGRHLGSIIAAFKAFCKKGKRELEAGADNRGLEADNHELEAGADNRGLEADNHELEARSTRAGAEAGAGNHELEARSTRAEAGAVPVERALSARFPASSAQFPASSARFPASSERFPASSEQFPSSSAQFSASAPRRREPPLFEPGYNDRILTDAAQLDRWKRYLADNPRRLWLKRNNRAFFTILRDWHLAGYTLQSVGNHQLLRHPDKQVVRWHRYYKSQPEVWQRLRNQWLDCAAQGGVLISPAIAPEEREVMNTAMENGYRVVMVKDNGFSDNYKPTGKYFDLCAAGTLLEVSPWDYRTEKREMTKTFATYMNNLAEELAKI